MSGNEIRLTKPALRVLRAILEGPAQGLSGAQISKLTTVGSGTLYPLLARLESAGWLIANWEMIDPHEAGRPRRRYYKFTAVGVRRARAELADLQVDRGEQSWVL
jgi:DNA-binding PadR family transcriptional regulator